ncbi:PREDICTED: cytochrome P450 CYP82D47-like isoform X1 [Ipomoea nil]|uniref:cytochrome P450 CYP82D47-like isoform X1 n=1 Tax=Ipomoea nil TaxID=35883 RepID=UPI000901CED3|nr:PREDICTED: cytochrome P450 CYP82D47-like isoform X1 [Ipomoea nil]
MDFTLLAAIVAALATTSLLLVTFIYNMILIFQKGSSQKPPQAGGAWPIIGHLHQLAAPGATYKILGEMADKYGPIFRIRLGAQQVLVVSDSRIAKECFTTNDRVLAGRPKSIASEIMGYNNAMFGLAPYGEYWRHVRKVVVVKLLSNSRLEVLGRVFESGVKSFTRDIYRSWLRDKNETENNVKLDMKEWFGKLIINFTMQMLFGKRYEEEGTVVTTVRRFFDLLATSAVGDYLPWLRWLDIGGHEKAMKETAKEMDTILEGWLQEHKRKRNNNTKSNEEEDFMDGLLSSFEDDKDIPKDFDADTILKATCMVVMAAATDTITITLIWALSLILDNYNVLDKIRAEIETHVGRERHVNQSDLSNLTYLQVVLKETLRLYPLGPLLLPHESVDDCMVNGYCIPKGTPVLVNISKAHRDPNFWSDPNVFRPERFMSEHKKIDVRGNHFELIPFASGRRMCPGISLALRVLELAMANLIHSFDLKRISNEAIDMTESAGLINSKTTPLYAFLTPRLPSHLYD